MSTARTFENCWRFSYLSDNWGVFFEMQCVAECDFYRLSTAADFSPYSC
jgi:hypothetical protein